jgi:hypothetical protein
MTDDRDWQAHDLKIEQLLASINASLRLIADILSELVPDRRPR